MELQVETISALFVANPATPSRLMGHSTFATPEAGFCAMESSGDTGRGNDTHHCGELGAPGMGTLDFHAFTTHSLAAPLQMSASTAADLIPAWSENLPTLSWSGAIARRELAGLRLLYPYSLVSGAGCLVAGA